ncbi:MAG: hypothetical protein Ct9H90mP10_00800 [Actinomycetota bacterium]|nr:MAG: hypothetical protein Ct9H90mP10_00800 [Actinomycetota bacterium]
MILEWHPHFDVWALIISLVIFFEYTTDNNELKKPKKKILVFWLVYSLALYRLANT